MCRQLCRAWRVERREGGLSHQHTHTPLLIAVRYAHTLPLDPTQTHCNYNTSLYPHTPTFTATSAPGPHFLPRLDQLALVYNYSGTCTIVLKRLSSTTPVTFSSTSQQLYFSDSPALFGLLRSITSVNSNAYKPTTREILMRMRCKLIYNRSRITLFDV